VRLVRAGAAGLRAGGVLNIYPEGHRTFDGDLHDFEPGAATLATELDSADRGRRHSMGRGGYCPASSEAAATGEGTDPVWEASLPGRWLSADDG
jgi:hypothetical protein